MTATAILETLDEAEIAKKLASLAGERKALQVLLRAVRARRRKPPTSSPPAVPSRVSTEVAHRE